MATTVLALLEKAPAPAPEAMEGRGKARYDPRLLRACSAPAPHPAMHVLFAPSRWARTKSTRHVHIILQDTPAACALIPDRRLSFSFFPAPRRWTLARFNRCDASARQVQST